jgi:hypothetical protein
LPVTFWILMASLKYESTSLLFWPDTTILVFFASWLSLAHLRIRSLCALAFYRFLASRCSTYAIVVRALELKTAAYEAA